MQKISKNTFSANKYLVVFRPAFTSCVPAVWSYGYRNVCTFSAYFNFVSPE